VCYYGEDVDDYEDGVVVGHAGAWRAGQGGNVPGIIMPAAPRPGIQFPQERAPGIAEDMSAVVTSDLDVSVPAGTFADTIYVIDWNPLENQTILDGDDKVYAPNIGLIKDGPAELMQMP
jgi:hypothetical protein